MFKLVEKGMEIFDVIAMLAFAVVAIIIAIPIVAPILLCSLLFGIIASFFEGISYLLGFKPLTIQQKSS